MIFISFSLLSVGFQSAVRIAVSLKIIGMEQEGGKRLVSIRRADRCLAEEDERHEPHHRRNGFNPPCGSLSR